MDLVVNAPLKAAIRRKRTAGIYDYFQTWRFQRARELAKPESERKLIPFEPPKPKLIDGLRTVLEVEETTLMTDKFKNSLRKCFVSVGMTRNAEGGYQRYLPGHKGTMTHMSELHAQVEKSTKKESKSLVLGDLATQLVLVSPPNSLEEREADEDGDGALPEEDDDSDDDATDDDE